MSDAWKSAPNAETYLPVLEAAEERYAIPHLLLCRIAYQESHYREDIVSGKVKSSAGCVGLMQLLPADFPNAGVSWQADVLSAGKYLADLYRQFKDWHLAVAAYDWGPGDVAEYKAGKKAFPAETLKYLAQVFADVPVKPGQLESPATPLSGAAAMPPSELNSAYGAVTDSLEVSVVHANAASILVTLVAQDASGHAIGSPMARTFPVKAPGKISISLPSTPKE